MNAKQKREQKRDAKVKAEIRAAGKAILDGKTPEPKASQKASQKVAKERKPPVLWSCACGCGSTCNQGRRFVQGHDARLKGNLQRLHANTPAETDQTAERIAASLQAQGLDPANNEPMTLAKALNPAWERFLQAVEQRAADRISRKAARDLEAKAQAAARAEKQAARKTEREAKRAAKAAAKQQVNA